MELGLSSARILRWLVVVRAKQENELISKVLTKTLEFFINPSVLCVIINFPMNLD